MGEPLKDVRPVHLHPNTHARDWAVRFLYQCESEKLFYFSEGHFSRFLQDFDVAVEVRDIFKRYVQGVLDHLPELNSSIEQYSKNWTVSRMAVTDRCVLRVAVYELTSTSAPKKVVINEAIELGKKYGTKDSGSFVNAILDKVAANRCEERTGTLQ